MKTCVFVYGTLKRGQRSHHLLAGQEFVCAARTLPSYRLYDLGPYPCLKEDSTSGTCVHGEVWRVDEATLRRLDEYEGVPDLYARREVRLEDYPDPVWVYVYLGAVAGCRDCGGRWPEGEG